MEVVTTLNAPGSPSASSLLPLFSHDVLLDYLVEVLNVTLGATKKDLEATGSLLSPSRRTETLRQCQRFATESQVSIYLSKEVLEGDVPSTETTCTLT